MSEETKILFNNIKNFRNRYLISEGVGEGDIRKYMEMHQFLYVFYSGDGKNPRGWRTIRPYVLGTSKAGNLVVRVWQDRGKSVSKDITKLRGIEHDYWHDDLDGVRKPGWRMFRLDKIEKLYPTGKKFVDNDGNVVFPPKYNHSGDKDMTSIIFQVSDRKEPELDVDTNTLKTQITPKRQKRDWGVFQGANTNRRKITPQEIINFKNIVNNIIKKKAGNIIITINNRNEFELVDIKDIHKVPEQSIVGNLARLYDKEVRQKPEADADAFYNKQRSDSLNEMKNIKINNFTYNIKRFLKN